MNFRYSVFTACLVFALALTVTTSPIFALERPTQPVRIQVSPANKDRCTAVTSRMASVKSRLTNDDNIRQNRHQKVIDGLNDIISKLDAKGINTDKLMADVSALVTKKAAWYQEYTALLARLDTTTQYACGESDGNFKQAAQVVRAQHVTMYKANLDFWNYVKDTVKPDLQAARSELKNKTTK